MTIWRSLFLIVTLCDCLPQTTTLMKDTSSNNKKEKKSPLVHICSLLTGLVCFYFSGQCNSVGQLPAVWVRHVLDSSCCLEEAASLNSWMFVCTVAASAAIVRNTRKRRWPIGYICWNWTTLLLDVLQKSRHLIWCSSGELLLVLLLLLSHRAMKRWV